MAKRRYIPTTENAKSGRSGQMWALTFGMEGWKEGTLLFLNRLLLLRLRLGREFGPPTEIQQSK